MSSTVRLQKFLADAGICSRRAAEKLILDGKVSVNGKAISELGTKIDPAKDKIIFDGKIVSLNERVLYIFHKPRGVITTMKDTRGRKCVGELIQSIPGRVYPVGRLDTDVNGILLLTNDGDFANQLMHPSFGVERTYWAICAGRINEKSLKLLKRGVILASGEGKFKDVTYLKQSTQTKELLGPIEPGQTALKIIAVEGRKHFVKEMLKGIGHPVHRLARVQYGTYKLGDLKPGNWKKSDLSC
jgi:23S rRNA pseudouridine2605 synthase